MTSTFCRRHWTLGRHSTFGCLLWILAVVSASLVCAHEDHSLAAAASSSQSLVVRNLSGETTALSFQAVAELPRSTVQAKIPHTDKMVTYEGVLLGHVLQQAGVQPVNTAQPNQELQRAYRSAYVLIEAADGYRVVFSLPEVFPESGGHPVLLADRREGKPLEAKAAPYQVIVAGSDMYDRWIRQVTRIFVQPGVDWPSPAPLTATAAKTSDAAEQSRGGVYLVGTGPGAADLITARAAGVLQKADLVFCFVWMKDELAPFVRPGAVEVASPLLQGGQYCGQRSEDFSGELCDRVARTNDELAKLKARVKGLVAQGKTVVFADNGDPMIFSPWGWVPELLAELNPTVVPGLSSFNAGNAALERPVAGLGYVTLSSGVELGSPDENGRLAGTVVFFTHRRKLEELLPKLQGRYPADTPVGVVCDVSYPTQKTFVGTLGNILNVLGEEKLPHLYLLYVGDGLKQACYTP